MVQAQRFLFDGERILKSLFFRNKMKYFQIASKGNLLRFHNAMIVNKQTHIRNENEILLIFHLF